MTPIKKAYLQLHVAIFLFGFTAILGRLVQISELPMVWWRLLITCTSLLLLPGVIKALRNMPRSVALQLAGIGIVVALHWITFFGAVNYSNVSVTLSTMATVSFFTAIIEPLINRERIKWYEVALGLLVIPGMYIIFRFSGNDYTTGIIMALISAALAAVFSTLNKKMVEKAEPMAITFVELGSGWIFLCLIAPLYGQLMGNSTFIPIEWDWLWLVILALLCTTFAYVLSLNALKHVSAFTANLSINLEPIYGIILAWLIFREDKDLSGEFYIGAGIILLSIFLHPILKRKFETLR